VLVVGLLALLNKAAIYNSVPYLQYCRQIFLATGNQESEAVNFHAGFTALT
jgi:hypothetical protein